MTEELKSEYPACIGCRYLERDVEYLHKCFHPRARRRTSDDYDHVRGMVKVNRASAIYMRHMPWFLDGCGKRAWLRKPIPESQ